MVLILPHTKKFFSFSSSEIIRQKSMVVECIVLEELEVSSVDGKTPQQLLDYVIGMFSNIDSDFKPSELKLVKLLGKQNEIFETELETTTNKKPHSSCMLRFVSFNQDSCML